MTSDIYGNPLSAWLLAATLTVLVALGLRLLTNAVVDRLQRFAGGTTNDVDDLLATLLSKTRTLFILLLAFWAGSEVLALPPGADAAVEAVVVVGFLVQAGFWGSGLVNYGLERYRRRQLEVDPSGVTSLGALGFLARAMVWTVIALTILANLGVNITAFVASLGIAGVAIGLALQGVVGDLLASLSIVLDRPFVVGDFITVGEFMGTVEHVGLKTTRIRSLSGEQLVFSNSDLLSSRIRNYKRMSERRAVFALGVTYDTPAEKLRRIPGMIREVIEAMDNTRFDRSHFKAFGPSSLDFETVYYMLVPDYNAYMDTQEAINLEVVQRLGDEEIELAFPTQTLYLQRAGAAARSVTEAR